MTFGEFDQYVQRLADKERTRFNGRTYDRLPFVGVVRGDFGKYKWDRDAHARYCTKRFHGDPRIELSLYCVDRFIGRYTSRTSDVDRNCAEPELLETIKHELVHAWQEWKGLYCEPGAWHDEHFLRKAIQVGVPVRDTVETYKLQNTLTKVLLELVPQQDPYRVIRDNWYLKQFISEQ